jgi:hypothetical protein
MPQDNRRLLIPSGLIHSHFWSTLMNSKILAFATLLCAIVSPAFANPSVTAVPGGVQAGNWKWTFDITPDLALVPDNSGTPVGVEFGFRLTGAQLLSATIADSVAFDTPNPGKKIFGWETSDPSLGSQYADGLQTNLVTGEIFAAYGSANFTVPGAKHFLTVITAGPPTSTSSTLQWLGVYGAGGSQGVIAQVNGGFSGGPYTTGDYFFSGSATQSIPEPACTTLVSIGAIALIGSRRRRNATAR